MKKGINTMTAGLIVLTSAQAIAGPPIRYVVETKAMEDLARNLNDEKVAMLFDKNVFKMSVSKKHVIVDSAALSTEGAVRRDNELLDFSKRLEKLVGASSEVKVVKPGDIILSTQDRTQ